MSKLTESHAKRYVVTVIGDDAHLIDEVAVSESLLQYADLHDLTIEVGIAPAHQEN